MTATTTACVACRAAAEMATAAANAPCPTAEMSAGTTVATSAKAPGTPTVATAVKVVPAIVRAMAVTRTNNDSIAVIRTIASIVRTVVRAVTRVTDAGAVARASINRAAAGRQRNGRETGHNQQSRKFFHGMKQKLGSL